MRTGIDLTLFAATASSHGTSSAWPAVGLFILFTVAVAVVMSPRRPQRWSSDATKAGRRLHAVASELRSTGPVCSDASDLAVQLARLAETAPPAGEAAVQDARDRLRAAIAASGDPTASELDAAHVAADELLRAAQRSLSTR